MRVAELIAPRRFRLTEGSAAEPGPGEVQVKVHAVGICGSDLHYVFEGSVGDTPCEYPMVIGHEPTGTIVKAGPGVTGWAPGDRAALEPAIYCYHCEFCRSGRHNVCSNLRFMSMPGDPGYFRDYVNIPSHNALPLPRELSFACGTLFEPLAVVLHSLSLAQPKFGETAAVFGAGPIGLLTIAALKMSGVSRLWAVEPVEARRELAKCMGADAAIDPAAVDPVRQIAADTGNRGVDFAIDCAAKGDSMNQCLRAVRNAGRVAITGIPSAVTVALDFSSMRRKEITLLNVRRSNHESETALEVLRAGRRRFETLITHEIPLEDVERAFGLFEHYDDGVAKAVVTLA